jgi:response regulator RpfG family c-di-GMP phosphodiesterase
VDIIEAAALLHTAGLIGVPKQLLEVDEKVLRENEKAVLMHAPVLAQSLFSSIDTLRQAGLLIRSHRERYDGAGYPDRLKGEEIPFGSRVIALCRVFDDARHGRHGPHMNTNALEPIMSERGRGLDPAVVDGFIGFLKSWKEEKAKEAVSINELGEGMTLAENLMTVKGRLLVAKGTRLSAELIEKILKFDRIEPLVATVHVESR